MNIQTEHLENHTVRFTVQLDNDRLEQAKQAAARNLAKRVNVPGFRKGKAPYKVLMSYVGEGAILEDAIEHLGNEMYKQALDASGLDPYGPGELEKFDLEPSPTFKFIVPLQPSVDLKDYRSVRLEWTAPTVEDEQVNTTLKALQEQHVLIEESHQPVAPGNQVTLDIIGEYVDGQEPVEGEQTEAEQKPNEVFINQPDALLILDSERPEPIPGFFQALEGANVGEQREFELAYPDDKEEYEDAAGRRAKFKVTIKKIETRTLPALNEDFAARVTANEEKPLTLLELRIRVRENLQKQAEQQAKADYAQQALDKMVEQAEIGMPEALIDDQIHEYLNRLDRDLRQRGLTLEDYMRIYGKTHEDLHKDYHDLAVNNLKRGLVLREVVKAEVMNVSDEQVNEEVERIIAQYGEQADSLRSMFDTPSMRGNVRNDLLEQHVLDRIISIAKGEAPELSAAPVEAESSSE